MRIFERKARIGVLLFGANRFRPMGEGTPNGTYEVRQEKVAANLIERFGTLGDVVFTGIVYDNDMVKKAMDAFYMNKVDCVFVAHLSWTEDYAWIRFLRDMPEVPILFMSLTRDKIDFENTYTDDNFCQLLVCNGLVGSLETSGSIRRFDRPMVETVSGTMDVVMKKAAVFSAAARVRGILRESTIGLLGSYNEVMWSTYVDPYSIFAKAGPEIHFYSVAELVASVEKVSDEDVQTEMKRLSSLYEMGEGIDPVKFAESVRASIGFDRLCSEAGVDLMVLNDIDGVLLRTLGLRPGFIPCTPDPAVVVPEGDIGSGLAVYILKILSGKQVNYIEPFYVEHDKQRIAVAHGGPNDYRDLKGKCIIGNDVRYAKDKTMKYAGAPIAWYTFPAGQKTMLHMSQNLPQGGSFKMVTAQIESLETEHFMTSYSHGRIRPVNGTCEEFIGKLIDIGVTQHYGMVEGNYAEELECLGKLMNYEFNDLDK